MKSTLKCNSAWRFLCFAMVVLLLGFAVLPLAASATPSQEDTEPVEWELSADEKTLTSGFDVYTLYSLPAGYYVDAYTMYYYSNTVDYMTIISPYRYAGLAWLLGYNEARVYATEDAAEKLDAFVNGEVSKFRLRDPSSTSVIVNLLDDDTVMAMNAAAGAGKNQKTVEVSTLRNVTRYDVVAHDETDSIAYAYGAIYQLSDEEFYYLNQSKLGNQYFDADGNFSYRSGSVTLTALDADLTAELEEVINGLSRKEPATEWEEDEISSSSSSPIYGNSDSAITGFWCTVVFFGLLLPIAPLVIGLVLPHSQKRGYPKYWYILAAVAGLWMFFSVILMIVVGVAI